MKRLAAFALLAVISLGCVVSASGQLMTPEENARRNRKEMKHQAKLMKKANKRQAKAVKKAMKAQRKQARQANRNIPR